MSHSFPSMTSCVFAELLYRRKRVENARMWWPSRPHLFVVIHQKNWARTPLFVSSAVVTKLWRPFVISPYQSFADSAYVCCKWFLGARGLLLAIYPRATCIFGTPNNANQKCAASCGNCCVNARRNAITTNPRCIGVSRKFATTKSTFATRLLPTWQTLTFFALTCRLLPDKAFALNVLVLFSSKQDCLTPWPLVLISTLQLMAEGEPNPRDTERHKSTALPKVVPDGHMCTSVGPVWQEKDNVRQWERLSISWFVDVGSWRILVESLPENIWVFRQASEASIGNIVP